MVAPCYVKIGVLNDSFINNQKLVLLRLQKLGKS